MLILFPVRANAINSQLLIILMITSTILTKLNYCDYGFYHTFPLGGGVKRSVEDQRVALNALWFLNEVWYCGHFKELQLYIYTLHKIWETSTFYNVPW